MEDEEEGEGRMHKRKTQVGGGELLGVKVTITPPPLPQGKVYTTEGKKRVSTDPNCATGRVTVLVRCLH